MQYMISVAQAGALIQENVQELPPIKMPLQLAAGLVLAEDVWAPQDIPAFPQSSMDGYAIAFDPALKRYNLGQQQIQAGDDNSVGWEPASAVRIFTGAAVPQGFDTVVIQENVRVENGELIIEQQDLTCGANVRPVGSEISKAALALSAGTVLTPAAIGFLAGIGLGTVQVFPRPKVQILVTGNELLRPGETLRYGQVFESNSFTLLAALQQMHIAQVAVQQVPDDLGKLERVLSKALEQADVVVLTGGVSVGDFDFTLQAFKACEVQQVFHKIQQKPGKPMLFGVKGSKMVFGLPGNPASVLTCFYQYVLPALERMMNKELSMVWQSAPLASAYKKKNAFTHFLKAHFDGSQVHLLTGQESYKLHSFATANSIAMVPEVVMEMEPGDVIQFYLLPQ